jgi:hypothetical protein
MAERADVRGESTWCMDVVYWHYFSSFHVDFETRATNHRLRWRNKKDAEAEDNVKLNKRVKGNESAQERESAQKEEKALKNKEK